jgi:hypothetical protein
VPYLSGTLPVEVEESVWEEAAEEIDDLVIGDAEVWCDLLPSPLSGDLV